MSTLHYDARVQVPRSDLEFLQELVERARRSTVYLDRIAVLGACSAHIERMLRAPTILTAPAPPSPTQHLPTGFTADDLRTPDGTRQEDYLPPPPVLRRSDTSMMYARRRLDFENNNSDADDEATEVVEPPAEAYAAAAAAATGDSPPPRRRRRTQ